MQASNHHPLAWERPCHRDGMFAAAGRAGRRTVGTWWGSSPRGRFRTPAHLLTTTRVPPTCSGDRGGRATRPLAPEGRAKQPGPGGRPGTAIERVADGSYIVTDGDDTFTLSNRDFSRLRSAQGRQERGNWSDQHPASVGGEGRSEGQGHTPRVARPLCYCTPCFNAYRPSWKAPKSSPSAG